MKMTMIALMLMVVVSDQSLPLLDIDQRVLKSVRRGRCPWDVVDLHFHQSALFIHVFRVEDQFRFRHMAVDTITV